MELTPNSPWDEPAKATPLADILALRHRVREHSVSLDKIKLSPEGAEHEWWGRLKPAGWQYDPVTAGFFHPDHRDGYPVSLGEAISIQLAIDHRED
jgi:hypothetical protein